VIESVGAGECRDNIRRSRDLHNLTRGIAANRRWVGAAKIATIRRNPRQRLRFTAFVPDQLHNSRITRLWMGCMSLKKNGLQDGLFD